MINLQVLVNKEISIVLWKIGLFKNKNVIFRKHQFKFLDKVLLSFNNNNKSNKMQRLNKIMNYKINIKNSFWIGTKNELMHIHQNKNYKSIIKS